jgi:hypothetical protein
MGEVYHRADPDRGKEERMRSANLERDMRRAERHQKVPRVEDVTGGEDATTSTRKV